MDHRNHHPRVGLALSGGSARGIAHIGVLKALVEHGIPIDCIAGTSAGAIVATGFAFGVPLEKIEAKARQLSWYGLANLPRSTLGIASNVPLEKMMEEFVGVADISEAHIPLAIVATDVENGEKVVFRKGKAALAVRASACIPGLFAPVEVDGRKLIDGELAEALPLSPLQEMRARFLIGVDVVPRHPRRKVRNVLDVMSNVVDILSSQQRRHIVGAAHALIQPDLAAYDPSDFKKADELITIGYQAASLKIPDIKKMLAKAGISLRTGERSETMFGRFLRWLRE